LGLGGEMNPDVFRVFFGVVFVGVSVAAVMAAWGCALTDGLSLSLPSPPTFSLLYRVKLTNMSKKFIL